MNAMSARFADGFSSRNASELRAFFSSADAVFAESTINCDGNGGIGCDRRSFLEGNMGVRAANAKGTNSCAKWLLACHTVKVRCSHKTVFFRNRSAGLAV